MYWPFHYWFVASHEPPSILFTQLRLLVLSAPENIYDSIAVHFILKSYIVVLRVPHGIFIFVPVLKVGEHRKQEGGICFKIVLHSIVVIYLNTSNGRSNVWIIIGYISNQETKL